MTADYLRTLARHRPRRGDRITYKGEPFGTVSSTDETGLCWVRKDGERDALPFIWAFRDGVNALHDWPGRSGAPVAFCPGVNTRAGELAP